MKVARTNGRFALAIVSGLAVALVGTEAMAWSYGSWGSSGSYGSSASYGSYGSSGSSASYGSEGSSGSSGRVGLIARIRARRAARQSHGSYGSYGSSGSSGSHGATVVYSSSYGSSGSYSTSTGSAGSYGSAGSAGYYGSTSSSHTHYAAAKPVVSTEVAAATIKVNVPEDATVLVNDNPTTSTGTQRSYVSRGLKSGMTYTYNFAVTYQQDGEQVTDHKTVTLSAGDTVPLTFGPSAPEVIAREEEQPVETKLTVTVPENAKVFLLGSETQQTGSQRSFTTTLLDAGQTWDNYEIRVELNRDGQKLVRNKTLRVEGGESYELAFDFADPAPTQLAQLDR